jgi:RHH-type proline utilization regulon transcriptional repressor/proline dehydrogenase/delta 1-pyrroline-5-carboxylate dehydrogenase
MNEANTSVSADPVIARGQQIFQNVEEDKTSIFNKDWWYGRIMDWSMKNEKFKVQMFRFVDVLPYLNSSEEISRHLKEYFTGQGQEMPSVMGWGLGLSSLAPGILASQVKKNVMQMARMFITGQDPDEALKNIKKMRDEKQTFTVDILGEAAVSEAEAWAYQKKYLDLIERLHKESLLWPDIEIIDHDNHGPISKVNVSVKVSSLYSQFDPIDPLNSINAVKEKLRPIFRRAKELGVFINLDMESYFHKDLTLKLFKNLMEEPEFQNHNNVGIVIQAYLRDSENDLDQLIEWAKKRSGRITVRLVKGAYWDYETVLAEQRGWPVPVYTKKYETDACFERLSTKLLDHDQYIKSAFGSHNIRSISHALVHAEKIGVDKRSFEIQMLFGMAEPIKKTLVKAGLRVRQYAPVGELIPGMAYLVRRLLENTSNEGFLRAKFSSNTEALELLRDPNALIDLRKQNGVSDRLPFNSHASRLNIFNNEPPVDFNLNKNRLALSSALDDLKKHLGKTYPLHIGKKEVKTNHTLTSVNPADPSMTLGKTCLASPTEADAAIESARETFKSWSQTSFVERAVFLERTAKIMREKKFELMAIEILEVGKTWREADGDVTEAIDFCMYYALEARKLGQPRAVSGIPGEESFYSYQPRGVGVVIAPWNFPLAILCGMVMGAAVCGNTVIMKPAEQSTMIAARFFEILREAGFPPGVISFLPGLGEEVGDYLVNHHHTDFIVFTGSKSVGLQIIANAAKTKKGQGSVKKVIAEMGGKNAIIIDSDADLDEAVLGTLHSAFGFQGQKCSACSRVIVLSENYEKFVTRLVEAARSLHVGLPENPGTAMGPVINEEAQKNILKMIEVGKLDGAQIAFQGECPSVGSFVPPTIFVNVKSDSTIAQDEIFGPVLAVIKATDFKHALEIANSTEFALTGGVYSRSPANLEKAKREFEVGNLYINRGITGAMVGRHPFGGSKMSGVGSKTGGPDYLLQFLEQRTVTENTLRRGFAPAPENDRLDSAEL